MGTNPLWRFNLFSPQFLNFSNPCANSAFFRFSNDHVSGGGGEGSSRRSEPRARNERSERGDRGGRDSGSGRGRDGGRSGGGSANAQRGGGGGSRSRSTVPEAQLELDHVYGYHGSRCRNNLFYTATGEIVRHPDLASLCVLFIF